MDVSLSSDVRWEDHHGFGDIENSSYDLVTISNFLF